jgi:hypothetical protein
MESQRGPPRTMTRETEVAFRWHSRSGNAASRTSQLLETPRLAMAVTSEDAPEEPGRLLPLGGGWTQAKGGQADKIGELSERWLIALPIFISHPPGRGTSVSLCCSRAPLCTLKQKPDCRSRRAGPPNYRVYLPHRADPLLVQELPSTQYKVDPGTLHTDSL